MLRLAASRLAARCCGGASPAVAPAAASAAARGSTAHGAAVRFAVAWPRRFATAVLTPLTARRAAQARRWASGQGSPSVFEGAAAELIPPPPPPSSPGMRAAKLLLGGTVTLLGGGLAYVAASACLMSAKRLCPSASPLHCPSHAGCAPPAAYDAAATEALLGPGGRAVSLVAGTALEEPVASAAAALLSARHTAAANIDYFAEPSSKKLLPDLPPHAASYMRTLGAR